MSVYDLIIIGGGPAGLTAGLYASRAKLKTLLIEKGWPAARLPPPIMLRITRASPPEPARSLPQSWKRRPRNSEPSL
jgi:thioredoxin reductase